MPLFVYGNLYLSDPRPKGTFLYDQLSSTAQTNLRALYSFKWCKSSYTGPIINIRRTSDNTTSDFYADTSGNLGQSAGGQGTTLTTWLTSTTGYVVKWYDQSGYGFDLSQNTAASQPQIITNDAGGICLYLTGTGPIYGQINTGKNLFASSSISDMHMIDTIKAKTLTYLVGGALNLPFGSVSTPFSWHMPYAAGNCFWDPGAIATNRISAPSNTISAGTKFTCSAYKKSSNTTNGFYLTANSTSYSVNTATSATVNGFGLNCGDGTATFSADAYQYAYVFFSTPLNGTADETVLLNWF